MHHTQLTSRSHDSGVGVPGEAGERVDEGVTTAYVVGGLPNCLQHLLME